MARRVSQECAKRKTPKRGSGALEWVRDAWRDWVNGERNWSALARRYGRERRTIKANVIRYSRALAAAEEFASRQHGRGRHPGPGVVGSTPICDRLG